MKQIDGTPRPHFDLKVKTSIYDKPTKAVALLDTGSCATILRPHVLPKEMWAPISKTFTAANSCQSLQRPYGRIPNNINFVHGVCIHSMCFTFCEIISLKGDKATEFPLCPGGFIP
ncbi:hypothetical protein Ahy_A06g027062 [Arachis hypogaea]|uniref:Uncharacterized protein n=1 Tax=Arachis hypogaea TaxID=3818 RepID=A0A445CMI4_ARAHY|nr:hypothetical protein Ahy_A06g027062 [Arachis hypogaea]